MPPRSSRKPDPTAEIGHAALAYSGGRPYNDWKIPELAGDNAFEVYQEMADNDPTVGAMLFAVDMQMRHLDWHVKPFSTSNVDKSRARFLEENIDDMSHSLASFVAEIMTMLIFGFSFFEICYKFRLNDGTPDAASKFSDGRIGWRKFAHRPQRSRARWIFDEKGGVRGFVQNAPMTDFTGESYRERTIPIIKGLLFRTKEEAGNPQGRSVLRNAFRPWWFMKRIENLEGVGIERDVAGIPVLKLPSQIINAATPELAAVLASYQNMLGNVRNDEQSGIILPSDRDDHGNEIYEFKLASAAGTKQFDTNEIIDRWNHKIAMVILAEFLLLGNKKQGSFALGAVKDSFFKDAINSWGQDIADIMNNYAIPRLFALNGYAVDRLPRLEFGEVKSIDVRALGDLLARLFGAGVSLFPDEQLEDYIRDVAAMPKRIEGAKAWEQVQPALAPPGETPGNKAGGRSPTAQRVGRGTTTGSTDK